MILGLYHILLAPGITSMAVRVMQVNSAITNALFRLSEAVKGEGHSSLEQAAP